ncbi:MAG: MFS transporter [Clostridia bacterium]|nr:MFS transporter [Clostridia bacterium]
MEYNLAPDDYEKEQEELAKKYQVQKEQEMQKAVKKAEKFKWLKKLFNLYDDEELYQKTFGSYMLAFCAEMVGILFILALLMGIGMPVYAIIAASNLKGFVLILACVGGAIVGAFGGIVAGFIAGFLGGFIYGGILGIVLFPLAYPLYRAVIPFKHKKIEIKKQKREKWENKIKSPFLEEIAQHQRDTEAKIAKYKQAFEEEAKKLSEKFANSTATKEIAKLVYDKFLSIIKGAYRDSHIEKISTEHTFTVYEYRVEYDRSGVYTVYTYSYNFNEHRFENLSTSLEKIALAKAIVLKVETMIYETYNKDISGTTYNIESTYTYKKQDKKDTVIATLTYTAPNGNYKPVQKW